jgi:NAD+ kinase
MEAPRIDRLGLVVHPRREIGSALAVLQGWSDEHGVELMQVPANGQERELVQAGDPASCDAIVALGGDGTTLAALRTAAAVGKPVMGVSCGSLGALAAVTADDLSEALDRLAAGDWTPRRLPALAVGPEGLTGVNDLVIVRQGAGQISAEVAVDGDLFIRFAGDGLVIATQLGSSAYTLAAGGPVLAPGGGGMVFTPLSAHGGCCPPLVAGADSRLTIEVDPGHGGARVEIDGQIQNHVDPDSPRTLEVRLRRDHATLVSLGGEESMLAGLRRRRVIMDSPRMLARSDREAASVPATNPLRRNQV